MSDYVIWLDSDVAQIFVLKTTGIEKLKIKKSGQDHHTQNKKDQHHDAHAEHFYRDLSLKIKDANHILILGPGLSKNHFVSHLQSHHSGGLDKKIIGIESSDHPTDNQILATARKFFVKYDLFNNPIKPL